MTMSRGEVMSRIRSRDTRLERRFADIARRHGVRLTPATGIYGNPDFRIASMRRVVFLNSCFWHGCALHCRMPHTRRDYWVPKINSNVRRQRSVIRTLRDEGYSVYVFWEHELSCARLACCMSRLKARSRR